MVLDLPLVSTVPIKRVMPFLRENRFPDDFVPRTERGEKARNLMKDPLATHLSSTGPC